VATCLRHLWDWRCQETQLRLGEAAARDRMLRLRIWRSWAGFGPNRAFIGEPLAPWTTADAQHLLDRARRRCLDPRLRTTDEGALP